MGYLMPGSQKKLFMHCYVYVQKFLLWTTEPGINLVTATSTILGVFYMLDSWYISKYWKFKPNTLFLTDHHCQCRQVNGPTFYTPCLLGTIRVPMIFIKYCTPRKNMCTWILHANNNNSTYDHKKKKETAQ